jgi:prevent-host-death family protein
MREQLEVGVRDLRDRLADVLNDTTVYGHITYITSRGRRVAALVPVPVADKAVGNLHEAGAV